MVGRVLDRPYKNIKIFGELNQCFHVTTQGQTGEASPSSALVSGCDTFTQCEDTYAQKVNFVYTKKKPELLSLDL